MKRNKFWPVALKAVFAAELAAETNKYSLLPAHTGERKFEKLPALLQQHMRTCGFAGQESVVCCRTIWKNTFLRFRPDGKWFPTEFLQVNFVPQPARLILMATRLWGFLNFGARDKYQDGKGSMLIRLFGRLTISDNHGRKMDRAELVTLLAETMILPVYALQSYTSWEQVDEHTIKGTMRDGHTSVSGLFRFDEKGLFRSFETNDRFYTDNGHYHAYGWTAGVGNYIRQGDLLLPSAFKATWHLPTGDHEYFRGELTGLELNNTALSDSLNDPAAAPKLKNEKTEEPTASF